VIPSEPLDLIDQVAADYLLVNPDVDRHRMQNPEVAVAWHTVRELAAAADGVLRAWHVPLVQRRFMATHLLEQAFGTPDGRRGAEMARQLAEAHQRDLDHERFMRELMAVTLPRPEAEAEVMGVRFRYVDKQWIEVDTP
jgi:hypothetical protein